MNTNNTSNSPFRINQRVICVEKKRLAKINGMLNEEIFTDNIYVVDELGEFSLSNLYYKWVKVSGMTTKWDVASFAPAEENKERIRYVAVSETLREKAEEVVVESCTLS